MTGKITYESWIYIHKLNGMVSDGNKRRLLQPGQMVEHRQKIPNFFLRIYPSLQPLQSFISFSLYQTERDQNRGDSRVTLEPRWRGGYPPTRPALRRALRLALEPSRKENRYYTPKDQRVSIFVSERPTRESFSSAPTPHTNIG